MRRTLILLVSVGAVALLLAGCFPAPATNVTTAVSNVSIPWDVQWTPDGTMMFTERAGSVEAIVGGQRRTLAQPADVVAASESGMLGLAIDPLFAGNRYVFTCFASTLGGPNDDVRIARWTVNATFTALTNRVDIVTGIPVNTSGELGRHSGCTPRFGPDGAIWVGTGDAASATVPQNLHSLGGKVLRIDRNGAGVSPNPGVLLPTSGIDPRIYNYGHRNVQGIAFRPSDGKAFSVEQGSDCDDEVNQLLPGANYGWDPVGPNGAYDESHPMTDLVKFPNAVPAVWSSGCPTIATSGATFLNGTRWGSWNGALVIGCLKGSKLFAVFLDGTGTRLVGTAQTLTDRGRLRMPSEGPDGNLYITTSNGADFILRLTPS